MVIAKESIDAEADRIVRRLRRNGHAAFLVGGCVRDLLLGRKPKDFDIATSATPPEIKDLFRNCRIIGRRFRLAHIFFGSKIIETSTFRANPREGEPVEEDAELLIRRDNVFGTAEEDARRRDFTINGLFYDVEAEQVIDYVGGLEDLEARMVHTIGDPDIRFREDPIRILRAIKFAARLGFNVEPTTYAAMLTHRGEIAKSAAPRVLEEVYRLLRGGAARRSMELLLETGVAMTLAPELAWMFGHGDGVAPAGFAPADAEGEARLAQERLRAWHLLNQIDQLEQTPGVRDLLGDGGPGGPTNAFLLAVLAAPFVPDIVQLPVDPAKRGGARDTSIEQAVQIEALLLPLVARLRVSRRDAERARQILLAQSRLTPGRRRRARPMALVKRDYFGEALALYQMMLEARGGIVGDETSYWHNLWRSTQPGGRPMPPEADAPSAPAAGGAPHPAESSGDPDQASRKRRRRRRGGRKRKGTVPGSPEATPSVIVDAVDTEKTDAAPAPVAVVAGTAGGSQG